MVGVDVVGGLTTRRREPVLVPRAALGAVVVVLGAVVGGTVGGVVVAVALDPAAPPASSPFRESDAGEVWKVRTPARPAKVPASTTGERFTVRQSLERELLFVDLIG